MTLLSITTRKVITLIVVTNHSNHQEFRELNRNYLQQLDFVVAEVVVVVVVGTVAAAVIAATCTVALAVLDAMVLDICPQRSKTLKSLKRV